jgi:hypothetical protein
MRKRHWLACLLSMWLSAVGGQAIAQPPPAGIPNDLGNPDLTGMMPPPYNQNYGPNPPQQYGGMPAGYPPGATAWPNITPYGPPVDETSNQNGLWFNRQLTGGKKYYFSLEGLIGNTTRPSDFVGDPQANTLDILTEPGKFGAFVDHNQQFFEQVFAPTGTPHRSLNATGGNGGGGNGGGNGGTSTDFPIFLGQSTGSITDRLSAAGMRGTWGWTNPDSSGLEASGWFIGPSSAKFFLGDQRPFNSTLFNLNPDIVLDRLHAFAGLPLSGADTDGDGLPGMVMPFDIYYRLQYTTQSGGANVDWFTTPIIDKPGFMLRAAYGARYMAIRETFQFDGADSGLGYTINFPSSGVGTGGNGGNGGNGATGTSNGFLSPAGATSLEPLINLSIMQSMLTSSVTTQLAGPEAGFRFDLGGDRFKVWTTSKLGLLVNYSSRNLSGYNIGDAYYLNTNPNVPGLTTMPRNNPGATKFAHQDSTTALSPLFEQSIFGKAKLFQYVPVLKKSKILSSADFQAGYTVIVVGNVYRPSQDIDWQAYPVSPLLRDKRGSFITSNYSFGMSWDY